MAACLAFGHADPVTVKPSTPPGTELVHFVAYNLHNYALKPSTEARSSPPKAEREIVSLIQILGQMKPDVLGVCEMGSEEDLLDLQQRLKSAGMDLPHREWVAGADSSRHLALLSRFPIIKRESKGELHYLMDETQLPVQRGLLDVTLSVSEHYQLRLVGLHLKSQRDTPEADQAMMRRQEAHTVRLHINSILETAPETNLLVYGDLNESKDQPGIRELKGPIGAPLALKDLALADSFGEKWTYYHEPADEYSRIDYALASASLAPEIRLKQSGIYGEKDWKDASDHRPLLVAILPIDQGK